MIKVHPHITRRKTRQIMVGDVAVGGNAQISVQSLDARVTYIGGSLS